MSDSFFSSPFFIVAAIAIFIIRTISQFSKKKTPPPRPHIPVHFEDDADDESGEVEFYPGESEDPDNDRNEEDYFHYAQSRGASEYFRKMTAAQTAAPAIQPAAPSLNVSSPSIGSYREEIPAAGAAVQTAVPAIQPRPPVNIPAAPNGSYEKENYWEEIPAAAEAPAPMTAASAGMLPPARDRFFNLHHLSPLKQAVVMAEILGSPKGMG